MRGERKSKIMQINLKKEERLGRKVEALRASRVLWVYCESQKENERLPAVLTLSESRQTELQVTAEKMTEKLKRKERHDHHMSAL